MTWKPQSFTTMSEPHTVSEPHAQVVELAKVICQHLYQTETDDLAEQVYFQGWTFEECRQHVLYHATRLEWYLCPGLGTNPDRWFLEVVKQIIMDKYGVEAYEEIDVSLKVS
jgi:hypothetical protein